MKTLTVILGDPTCRECGFPAASGRHMTATACDASLAMQERRCEWRDEHHPFKSKPRVQIVKGGDR